MSECVASSDVVDKKGSCSSAVIRPSYALERLLPSSVPDLQFNILVVDLDRPRSELDSDCQIVLLSESLVGELEEETGLADS